jgi:hypothetical protein
MPHTPLQLTDVEMDAVLRAAAPVHPSQRDDFLRAMAAELAQHAVIGEGLIHRLAMEWQRRFVVSARVEAATRLNEPSPRARQGRRQAATERQAGP